MKTFRFIGFWLWNIIQSLVAVPYTLILDFPKRFLLLFYHIISGTTYLFLGIYLNFKLLFTQIKSWPTWILKRIIAVLAWVGRLIGKSLDTVAFGEILDLIFQILKPNSRALTDIEKTEAKKVFGNGIRYWKVRIDEFSLIAKSGALFAGTKNMGVTTFHTVNFTKKIVSEPGSGDMEWLIHELAHVCQMEHAGSQYIVEALFAQYTEGYDYGGSSALKGKTLRDFNREQQAEIAADYYRKVLNGHHSDEIFLPLIKEFNNKNRLWLD